MKRLFLVLIVMISTCASTEEDIRFSVNCKVLDQMLLKTEDGKAKRYSGIEGWEEIGATARFRFVYQSNGTDAYKIRFDSPKHRMGFFTFNDSNLENAGSDFVKLQLKEGSMFVGDSLFSSGSDKVGISGERYYKNDWSFSLHHNVDQSIFVQSLNCLGMPQAYDEVLNEMLEVHKAKSPKL